MPTCVVVGGTRCGTTSLHYYLGRHPEIVVSREKELDYFIQERNWPKGPDWYQSQFKPRRGAKACVECSPSYTVAPYWDGVPGRMHALLPDARLIYVLRDPLKRMISHYRMTVDLGFFTGDISAAVRGLAESPHVQASLQHAQLTRFLEYYPLSRFLLFTQEEFAADRRSVMQRVFRFLGVEESFWDPRFERVLHDSESKSDKNGMGRLIMRALRNRPGRKIPLWIGLPLRRLLLSPFSRPLPAVELEAGLERRLLELFREDTARLRQLTGLTLPDWCV